MRIILLLATASTLAACAGAGPETVGSVAPPASGGTSPSPPPTASFVNPTEAKTYDGVGGVQHYQYTTRSDHVPTPAQPGTNQDGQLYAGDANTARDSGISVTYDPRDAIFNLTINRPKGSVSVSGDRFQDPANRTNFGGLAQPQPGAPILDSAKNIQYLTSGSATGSVTAGRSYDLNNPDTAALYPEAGDSSSTTSQTFFYQKPGTTTKYVTFAGYLRTTVTGTLKTDPGTTNPYLVESYSLDRAVFAYGERTSNSAVPTSGSGTYTGDMIASLVFNPRPDSSPDAPTYFQWISGTQSTIVDFGKLSLSTTFSGTVTAPALDAYTSGTHDLKAGSLFSATATSVIDLVGKGGFSGAVTDAKFTSPDGRTVSPVVIAGSSVDGAFFGPKGEEIGGGFRIVGGTPDQRIDILGAFTGKK